MERLAGRYALLRQLGQGGMGRVWLALDLTNDTECALKQLETRLARSERDSLRREFELLTRVRHPAVVSVNELGFASDGTPFYTMEFVPGQSADVALLGADWATLFDVAARVADGLEALHAAGIVHGDVKPSNLLVLPGAAPGAPPAGVRWVDFGLSVLLDRERSGHRGTPGFAAPEVVRGLPLSVASDLYGLGATLFVLAMGIARGGEATPATRATPARPPNESTAAAVALEEASVPAGLAQLIVRLLSSSPESRPANAREVRMELARLHVAARRTLEARLRTDLLVGRRRELMRFERWLAASSGARPLILLSGAAGVGKSTLLRELAVRASLAGRMVVTLPCAPGDPPGTVARTLLLRLAIAAKVAGRGGASHLEVRRQLEQSATLRESDLSQLVAAAMAWGLAVREHGERALLLIDDCEHLDELSRALVRRMLADDDRTNFRWVWTSATSFAGSDSVEACCSRRASRSPCRSDSCPGSTPTSCSPRACKPRHPSNSPTRSGRAAGTSGIDGRGTASGGPLGRTPRDRQRADAGPRRTRTRDVARRLRSCVPCTIGGAVGGPARGRRGARRVGDTRLSSRPHADRAAGRRCGARGPSRRRPALSRRGRSLCAQPSRARARHSRGMPEADRIRLFRAALDELGLPFETRFRLHRGAGDARRALAEAERSLSAGVDLRLAVEAAELAAAEVPEEAAAWAVAPADS